MWASEQLVFVFRCDGSLSIGMGHVIRCLSLALALRERGCSINFAMRDLPGRALAVIHGAGFGVDLMPESPDGHGVILPEADAEAVLSAARRADASCVLVDHYGVAPKYLQSLSNSGLLLAVIDDKADRDLTAADWILNQNLGASTLHYRVRSISVNLMGPKYALLRAEFASVRTNMFRRFSFDDRHVLVTLGGGDTVGPFLSVIEALELVTRLLDVRCVVGGTDPIGQSGKAGASRRKHQIQVFRNVTNMAEQMRWADLSINAGGTTCWELMCLGVPMIMTVLSEDQRLNAQALEELNYAKRIDAEHLESLPFIIEELFRDPKLRGVMSERSMSLVDGNGAGRAAESLMQLVDGRRGLRGNAAR